MGVVWVFFVFVVDDDRDTGGTVSLGLSNNILKSVDNKCNVCGCSNVDPVKLTK